MTRRFVRAAMIVLVVALVAGTAGRGVRRAMHMPRVTITRTPDAASGGRLSSLVMMPSVAQDTTDDESDTSDDASDDADDNSPPDHAQHATRTLTIGRQFRAARDTASLLHVNVSYGVGSLSFVPADVPWLYNVRQSSANSAKAQSVQYDTVSRTLEIGGSRHSTTVTFGGRHQHDSEDSELRVGLARGVPLGMTIEFGAGQADLQLGGLSIRDLTVSTGASDATVRFGAPNPVVLDRIKFEVGAAGFKAVELGNAHVRTVIVEAGVGDVDLDFGGHWTGDIDLELTAALGAVHVHVPRGVVLQQTRNKIVLGSIDDNTGGAGGAGAPQTPGGPMYHLIVHGSTTMGSIDFDRQVAN